MLLDASLAILTIRPHVVFTGSGGKRNPYQAPCTPTDWQLTNGKYTWIGRGGDFDVGCHCEAHRVWL